MFHAVCVLLCESRVRALFHAMLGELQLQVLMPRVAFCCGCDVFPCRLKLEKVDADCGSTGFAFSLQIMKCDAKCLKHGRKEDV